MNRRGPNWNQHEIETLRAYYRDTPPEAFSLGKLASIMDRPRFGVAIKASRLGLCDSSRRKPWNKFAHRKLIPHPRGMLGKKHSDATKARYSEARKKLWKLAKITGTIWMTPESRQKQSDRMSMRRIFLINTGENCYSRAKRGKRADLGGIHFRSGWEANYARYLNFQIKQGWISKWEYEPKTFWFLKIKRGVRSYTPDFKVWPANGGEPYFDEVKGWMDDKSKTKLKRMKKYYPAIVINLIDERRYKGIAKTAGALIPNWE